MKPPVGQTEEATTVLYLRIPPSLKKDLRDAADRARRTVNADVVLRLERSLSEYPPRPDDQNLATP